MTIYARLTQDQLGLDSLVDLTVDQYESIHPWKRSFLRLYVVDEPPVPSASQTVVEAGPLIDATTFHRTWALADKTQAELDTDAQAAELTQLQAVVDSITADIQAGLTAAPTTQAQAFLQIQDLKRRALRTDRAVRWLIKQQA